jgi:hypothetical protein
LGGKEVGRLTDFPGVFFGKTTLDDLRARFKSKGFSYQHNFVVFPEKSSEQAGYMFNAYQIADRSNEVVVFVTKLSAEDYLKHRTPDLAVVVGIILADIAYLDALLGDR